MPVPERPLEPGPAELRALVGSALDLLDRINATRRVLLSSTRIAGRTHLRIAVLSFRTHEDRVREVLGIASRAADPVGRA